MSNILLMANRRPALTNLISTIIEIAPLLTQASSNINPKPMLIPSLKEIRSMVMPVTLITPQVVQMLFPTTTNVMEECRVIFPMQAKNRANNNQGLLALSLVFSNKGPLNPNISISNSNRKMYPRMYLVHKPNHRTCPTLTCGIPYQELTWE